MDKLPPIKHEPLDIDTYIELLVKEKLSNPKMWFRVVEQNIPNGIIGSKQIVDDEGNPQLVEMIQRTYKSGQYSYIVILNRQLSEEDTAAVVDAWTALNPDGDFEIEASADIINSTSSETEFIDETNHDYDNLAMELSKSLHEKWMKNKLEAGWRYGNALNESDKTNPMLRPWLELPPEYREVDYGILETVLETLERMGYKIITN